MPSRPKTSGKPLRNGLHLISTKAPVDKAVAHLIVRGEQDANGSASARACAVFNGRFDSCGAF